jgi:hypothetical protein
MERRSRAAKQLANTRIFGGVAELLDNWQDNFQEIIIVPPEKVDDLTDDEIEEVGDAINLPTEIAGTLEVHEEDVDIDIEEVSPSKGVWMKGNMKKSTAFVPSEDLQKLEEKFPLIAGKDPYTLFLALFDENIQKLIINETNRYAKQRNDHGFQFGKTELLSFVAILFTTGFNTRPQEWMYWSKDETMECPFVAKLMSSKQFKRIKRNIHFANNLELKTNDKFAKIRPLVNLIRKSLGQFGVFSHHLCVDEQMIPFNGRHSCKMFMANKPIRFGYKCWVLCNSNGYPFDFDLYQGASTKRYGPLGSHVVLELLKGVHSPQNHQIYFDNFFTSHSLLSQLVDIGFRATGTVRRNRTNGCPLTSEKEFNKTNRGAAEVWNDGRVSIVQWNDSKVVCVATNFDDIDPKQNIFRWIKSDKVRIQIEQPRVIHHYNLYMGGVDSLNNAISNLRPTIRSKKW